jgi:hypothetical protein
MHTDAAVTRAKHTAASEASAIHIDAAVAAANHTHISSPPNTKQDFMSRVYDILHFP